VTGGEEVGPFSTSHIFSIYALRGISFSPFPYPSETLFQSGRGSLSFRRCNISEDSSRTLNAVSRRTIDGKPILSIFGRAFWPCHEGCHREAIPQPSIPIRLPTPSFHEHLPLTLLNTLPRPPIPLPDFVDGLPFVSLDSSLLPTCSLDFPLPRLHWLDLCFSLTLLILPFHPLARRSESGSLRSNPVFLVMKWPVLFEAKSRGPSFFSHLREENPHYSLRFRLTRNYRRRQSLIVNSSFFFYSRETLRLLFLLSLLSLHRICTLRRGLLRGIGYGPLPS